MANLKTVEVSRDGTNYYVLPGSAAEINRESSDVDDSIFGTAFASSQPTSISWNLSANGYFKGFPGYKAALKRTGVSTPLTDGSMSLDPSTGIYYLNNRSQSILDKNVPVEVYDDGSIVDKENIEYIDYLQGGVKFVRTYNVNGQVTINSANYLPARDFCFIQNFTLTQNSDTEDISDFCTLFNNGGYSVFAYQQQSAELSLDGFYTDYSEFMQDLDNRSEVIIEVNPDGEGKSVARGYFRATSHSQSGDAGSSETENTQYKLSTPEGVPKPFSWYHSSDSAIPQAIKLLLDLWAERSPVHIRYRPENSNFVQVGKALIEDCSLEGAVDGINEFSFSLKGTGCLERRPV